MADVARVQYLVVDRDPEVLSSYSPVMVNRVDPTYDRISLMVCGLDPQKRTRSETDLDCVGIAKMLYNAGVNISPLQSCHHKRHNSILKLMSYRS